MTELWTWPALEHATDGEAVGAPVRPVSGISIDTRTLQPGDLFVALKDQRDGHEFVAAAFAAGAAGALVEAEWAREQRQSGTALICVDDTLSALQRLGQAARARSRARIVAVTGSAGKTGTKEALRLALSAVGPTHASEKSYNNHWGVPLTLARMPEEVMYGVFEIGMNHPGEIEPLTRMVRPHIAIVTTVEAVHLGQFASVEEIADAKAEIFAGLEAGGTAILNRDNAHFERLKRQAEEAGATIMTFGAQAGCDVRLLEAEQRPDGSDISVDVGGRHVRYRLGVPGRHIALNSLAVVAALQCLQADLTASVAPLAELSAPAGRGARIELSDDTGAMTLIDESYNANPASMRAALETMAGVPRAFRPRRVAVMGEMLELGPAALEMHLGLNKAIDAAGVDLVFACGPCMKELFDMLPEDRRAAWSPTSEGLLDELLATVRAGDVIMVKGSLGTRMAPLVAALKARFAAAKSRHC